MPNFICPVKCCKYHDSVNCILSTINVEIKSDGPDVTLVCNQQKNKEYNHNCVETALLLASGELPVGNY